MPLEEEENWVPSAVDEKAEEKENRPLTEFDGEWLDHKALLKILIHEAVPVEEIENITQMFPTEWSVEDAATINSRLITLGVQHGLPQDWVLKEMQKAKYRKRRGSINLVGQESVAMGWLKKKAGPFGDDSMDRRLPTKGQPGLGGKVSDDPLDLPAGGPMGPSSPAPKPPMGGPSMNGKPPMGKPTDPGAAPMGPDAPSAGADKVKDLLDKGDMKAALEELKKLVGPGPNGCGEGEGGPGQGKGPGRFRGGDDKPDVPGGPPKLKAPDLGDKPALPGGDKPPMPGGDKPKPPMPGGDKDPSKLASIDCQCSHCGALLEVTADLFDKK